MKNEIIKDLIDQLDGYEGSSIYGCDMAYTLFEGYNVDGSVTYNTYQASEWLNKYRTDVGYEIQELEDEGLPTANPFLEPEKLMVQVYLKVADDVLSQCELIEENWNDKLELTKENIKKLTEELEGGE